jgi:hypothetical protein
MMAASFIQVLHDLGEVDLMVGQGCADFFN